jgi:hypothetical protein
MRQSEHPLRLCSRPHGPPRHTRPPPLRRDHFRQVPHVQMLQGLVSVRVQQPPPVPGTHPLPARQIPHRPCGLSGAPRSAQPAGERRFSRHRARRPPPRLRHGGLPAAAGLRIIHGERGQSAGQHLRFHPAQLGEHTPPGFVEHDLRVSPYAAAVVVPGGGVGEPPQPQHIGDRQTVAVRGPVDQ